jgi:hypothetical protein
MSPLAWRAPWFLAKDGPAFFCDKKVICDEKDNSRAAVSSVEPSSTTMTSIEAYVWFRALRTASGTVEARLYVGMMTETLVTNL